MKIKRMPFSTWSVLGILADRKSQTRRVMKPQPCHDTYAVDNVSTVLDRERGVFYQWLDRLADKGKCVLDLDSPIWRPRYKVGEVVAMGEALVRKIDQFGDVYVGYENGGFVRTREGLPRLWGWKPDKLPSIHMPLWAARRWLRITDVRAERALDISEEDALAEGLVHEPDGGRTIPADRDWPEMRMCWQGLSAEWFETHTCAFSVLLRRTNPAAKLTPKDNPWVFAYTFEPVDRPEGESDV